MTSLLSIEKNLYKGVFKNMTKMNSIDLPSSLVDLLKRVETPLVPIFKEFNVSFAYLAGSWIRERHGKLSDIDIFVSWPDYLTATPETKLKVWNELSRKASEITKLDQIEITIMEELPLQIQFQVISEGKVLYQRSEEERMDFIETILNQYYDYIIWYQSYLNQAM